jgi:ADP-ribosylglycohydrolase
MDINLLNSKLSGVILGVIVGDLLGEQVESTQNPGLIRKFRSGAKYTDDTEMTLITLQHLLSFKRIEPMILALEYAGNFTPSRKYGGNMIKTLKKIREYPELWDSVYKEFLGDGSWGNGCLMRVAPIGLFCLNESYDTLRQYLNDCLLATHSHIEALECSIEYCLLLREFFFNQKGEINADQLLSSIITRNSNQRLTDKVKLIKDKVVDSKAVDNYNSLFKFINTEVIEHGIRSSDTLAVVIGVLAYNAKYKQWTNTQLLTIIISFGGDTDTNASILGALIGALSGIDWIDVDWFNNIENKKNILIQLQSFSDLIIKDRKLSSSSV